MLTSMNLNQSIAERVLTLRQRAGLSRDELSEASGIALRTLARRESGRSAWTTDELSSIAAVLDVAPSDFMPHPAAEKVSA